MKRKWAPQNPSEPFGVRLEKVRRSCVTMGVTPQLYSCLSVLRLVLSEFSRIRD
jgi:hypothetical protein